MVSCYSIYKVHPLAAANFDILAQNFPFVKNFFQVFANFFFVLLFSVRSPERLDILAYHSVFVKHFFHFFSTFLFSYRLWYFCAGNPYIWVCIRLSYALRASGSLLPMPIHRMQMGISHFLRNQSFSQNSRFHRANIAYAQAFDGYQVYY